MKDRKPFKQAELLTAADTWMTVFGMERVDDSSSESPSFEGLTFVIPLPRVQGWSEFIQMFQRHLEALYGHRAANSLVVSTVAGDFNFVVNCCVRKFKQYTSEKPEITVDK